MTRRNAPRLIDPRHDPMQRTDHQLGIEAIPELMERIATLERTIAAMNDRLQRNLTVELPQERRDVQVVGGDVVLTQYANLIAFEENPNPGLTIGTAAGTGGSAAVSFPRGGSDAAGQIRVVCGTSGLSTGTLVTLTFNRTKPNTNYIVLFSPGSSAARAVNLSVSTLSTTGFPILANTAPASGAQVDIFYLVIEVPAT